MRLIPYGFLNHLVRVKKHLAYIFILKLQSDSIPEFVSQFIDEEIPHDIIFVTEASTHGTVDPWRVSVWVGAQQLLDTVCTEGVQTLPQCVRLLDRVSAYGAL